MTQTQLTEVGGMTTSNLPLPPKLIPGKIRDYDEHTFMGQNEITVDLAEIETELSNLRKVADTATAQANFLARELERERAENRELRNLINRAARVSNEVMRNQREILLQPKPFLSSTIKEHLKPHNDFKNSGAKVNDGHFDNSLPKRDDNHENSGAKLGYSGADENSTLVLVRDRNSELNVRKNYTLTRGVKYDTWVGRLETELRQYRLLNVIDPNATVRREYTPSEAIEIEEEVCDAILSRVDDKFHAKIKKFSDSVDMIEYLKKCERN